jgi:hypothetical protein
MFFLPVDLDGSAIRAVRAEQDGPHRRLWKL